MQFIQVTLVCQTKCKKVKHIYLCIVICDTLPKLCVLWTSYSPTSHESPVRMIDDDQPVFECFVLSVSVNALVTFNYPTWPACIRAKISCLCWNCNNHAAPDCNSSQRVHCSPPFCYSSFCQKNNRKSLGRHFLMQDMIPVLIFSLDSPQKSYSILYIYLSVTHSILINIFNK